MQLRSAIAAMGTEHIAGQAFRVNPDHHRFFRVNLSLDQGDVFLVVHIIGVTDRRKIAEIRRKTNRRNPSDQCFLSVPIADQILDGNDLQVILLGDLHQFGEPGPSFRLPG